MGAAPTGSRTLTEEPMDRITVVTTLGELAPLIDAEGTNRFRAGEVRP
jgi:hypothetical protein